MDTLLLRIKAQLVMALGDANQSLCVLGSAKKRLSAKRAGLGGTEGAAAVAEMYKQQEAQVGGGWPREERGEGLCSEGSGYAGERFHDDCSATGLSQ
jgi:hypothetical protein